VADGPDLVVTSPSAEASTTPGAEATFPFTFANLGSETAHGITGFFGFSPGFVPATYDNCEYFVDPEETLVLCDFGDSLDVNAAVTADFAGKISTDAAAVEAAFGGVGTAFDDPGTDAGASPFKGAKGLKGSNGFKHRARTGTTLNLHRAARPSVSAGDIDLSDNFAIGQWDVKTSHDAVAIGASLTGAKGSIVGAKIGLKNLGPASLGVPVLSSKDLADVVVSVPAGAAVAKAPEVCNGSNSAGSFNSDHWGKSGYKYYLCVDEDDVYVPVGTSVLFSFKFKITGSSSAAGSVSVETGTYAADGDTDPSNNTAKITLAADDQPSLPITGAKAGLIGGVGAGVLLLGVLLVIVGRRRKQAAAI
jgi:hypothetical protein